MIVLFYLGFIGLEMLFINWAIYKYNGCPRDGTDGYLQGFA